MAAAVADARPRAAASQKMKKQDGALASVSLEPNPDILADLGRARGDGRRPVLIGFAAETQSLIAGAQAKLASKRVDAIFANDVSGTEGGFESDDNRATLVTADGVEEWALMSKDKMAHRILDWMAPRL
jgi:phosphopantothenoylcysteine decarboxylase/phosphopantothenate--cysteine ligase